MINHHSEIERKVLDNLPNFLDQSQPDEIEQYYENLHILTKYLITTPDCLISPSKINNGRIYRSDVATRLQKENDYIPTPLNNNYNTDPIWFSTDYPSMTYLNEKYSSRWIIACRRTRDFQIKNDEIIGYNFYVNFNGEIDKDESCKNFNYDVYRLNIELMKLIDNLLQLAYKKDIIEMNKENYYVIPKYNIISQITAENPQIIDAFSYIDGTRNSAIEIDRYIVNKMMIIFDNVEEIIRKQKNDIFINNDTNLKNKINILGYYEGSIALNSIISQDCTSLYPEVAIKSKYFDKKIINQIFYFVKEEECKIELIDLVNKSIMRMDGGNLRKTKKKITRIKNKNNKTVYNKMSDYLENGWFKPETRNIGKPYLINSYEYAMRKKRELRTEYFRIIEVIKNYVIKLSEEPDEKMKQQQIKDGFYIYRRNLHEYHRELREQNIPYDEADDNYCLGFSEERHEKA